MSRSMGKGTTPKIFCALPRKSTWKRFRCTVSSCGALHSAYKDRHTLPRTAVSASQDAATFAQPLWPISWCQSAHHNLLAESIVELLRSCRRLSVIESQYLWIM